MIQFRDGPAAGKLLELQRAPFFLRVVEGPAGEIDALDQVQDKVEKTEKPIAYCRVTERGSVYVLYTDKGRRRGKWLATGAYKVSPLQPSEAIMRSNNRWRKWCEQKIDEVKRMLWPATG